MYRRDASDSDGKRIRTSLNIFEIYNICTLLRRFKLDFWKRFRQTIVFSAEIIQKKCIFLSNSSISSSPRGSVASRGSGADELEEAPVIRVIVSKMKNTTAPPKIKLLIDHFKCKLNH